MPASGPHRVAIHTTDPLTRAGLTAMLRGQPEIIVLADQGHGRIATNADVVVVAPHRRAVNLLDTVHAIAATTTAALVLLLDDQHTADLFAPVDCGAAVVLLRSRTTAERLTEAVSSITLRANHSTKDAQARLLAQIRHIHQQVTHPDHLDAHGLTAREVTVIRLVADGLSLRNVGEKLSYSERTVKYILHGATTRLGMRGRTEMVAYASRVGAI